MTEKTTHPSTKYHYNPAEAIRIAEDTLPKLEENHIFSSRYVLSNMRQMKEKAEKYDGEHRAAMIVEEELRKIDDKLEAVKTHRENFRHSSYIEWLRELDKILEA